MASTAESVINRKLQGKPLAVLQSKVIDLIRSLVTDGLFELGDLPTESNRFGAWDQPRE